MLLGIPGDNTFSNYQEANRTFWRNTVIPLATRTASAMANWLGAAYGENLTLKLDLDQVQALASEREALWTRLDKSTFLTPNEKRSAAGYGPLVGGDALKFAPSLNFKYPGQPRTEDGEFDFGRQEGDDGSSPNFATIDVGPSPDAAPQADPSEWPTWDNPNLVPVADKPQFSPDKFGGHDYSVGPNLICGSELKCTAQEMVDQLSRYGVPGRDPSQPVENGGTYPVYDPRNGMFGGYVKTTVSENGLAITNRTQPGHLLYDGQITRQALQAADGSWYVYTRGTGNNVIPGFNAINEWQGPEIFRTLDKNLRDSISRHHGVSRQ